MPKITVEIPQESKDFLTNYIIFEDAAKNQSEAVNWCIDSCIKIEKKYGVDACYVAHNNIILDELKDNKQENNETFFVKFFGDADLMEVKARNFIIAGVMATAHRILEKPGDYGIQWIQSKKTGHKDDFSIIVGKHKI